VFFTVFRKPDGSRLTYGMRPFLRVALLVGLISVVGMFFVSLTPEDIKEAPMIGRINLVVVPVLLLLGVLYQYRLVFDKKNEEIYLDRGLVFLFHRKVFSFDDVNGILIKSFPTRKIDPAGIRFTFGFYLTGKTLLLERGAPPGAFENFYYAFKVFFPRPVNEDEAPVLRTHHKHLN